MKKILVFTSSFNRFTENDTTPPFVYELSRRLAQKGANIIVLTPRVPWALRYEEREWMKIYRYPYFFNNKWEKLNDWAILPNIKQNKLLLFQVPFLLLFWFINLIKLVKNEKIDTIHAHWIIPQWFLAVLYKKLFNKDIKVVCTTHWWDIFWLRWKIWTIIKKYTLKNVDKLTVVSNAIKKECIKLWVNNNNVDVVPMGVDTELFLPDNYDENIKKEYNINWKCLLFVWRLAEKKWVKYLIEAMKWIVRSYSDIKLLIIWNWPLENELKQQVLNLGLNENIIFIWAVENKNLPKYYATADMFIWPSIIAKDWDSEWFWLVFVESILSWTITIWSNLYWIKDIIEDWKTGFLIEEKNSSNLEKKVIEVINNSDFDKKLARDIMKNKFSWKVISKKYFNLLNK